MDTQKTKTNEIETEKEFESFSLKWWKKGSRNVFTTEPGWWGGKDEKYFFFSHK